MKVEFLSSGEIEELHSRGETVIIHHFPYENLPEDFGDQECILFAKLEDILVEKFGSRSIYVSYETWADLVIRTYVDSSIFNRDLIRTLLNFCRDQAPGHYLSCVI